MCACGLHVHVHVRMTISSVYACDLHVRMPSIEGVCMYWKHYLHVLCPVSARTLLIGISNLSSLYMALLPEVHNM